MPQKTPLYRHQLTRPLGWLVTMLLPIAAGCGDGSPIEPTVTPTETIIPPTLPAETSSPTSSPTVSATPSTTPPGSATPTSAGDTPSTIPSTAVIVISETSIDFGMVTVGSSGTAHLLIGNEGEADLLVDAELTGGASSSFRFDASVLTAAIPAGASVDVTLNFEPLAEGSAKTELRLSSNDPFSSQVDVLLSGTGVSPAPDDLDGDGSPSELDCDDSDPNTYPDAPERCDGKDNDCDGIDEDNEINLIYADQDGDGHGDPADASVPSSVICEVPAGYALSADDCDDTAATTYSGAPELCDGLDNDCDNTIDEEVKSTFYSDLDDDGHGDITAPVQACSATLHLVSSSDDCNDLNNTIYPGAPELCDGLDNDCDLITDEDLPLLVLFADSDLDGYGDATDPVSACGVSEGITDVEGDCNDSNATIYPGAVEACDGLDNDCDEAIDEDDASAWYTDADGDGYGDPTTEEVTCQPTSGQVSNALDCNDSSESIKPGAFESCDLLDNDCDNLIDEGVTSTFYADNDKDGYGNPQATASGCTAPTGYVSDNTDCNDADSAIHPNQTEACNGRDDNCNAQVDEGATATYYVDGDGDTHGDINRPVQACAASAGVVASSDDCNDADAGVYPGNAETCDLKDNDCDSQIDEGVKNTYYVDADEDGYGNPSKSTQACTAPAGYVSNGQDCNDRNLEVYPGAPELCNGKDDDCDAQVDENVTSIAYKDADSDTYGDPNNTLATCAPPSGYVGRAGDCNDANAAINPGATEVCNSVDDDCDAQTDEGVKLTWYLDTDLDAYGGATSTQACTAPSGYVSTGGDCNDNNNTVYPGATERCDGLDNDCDGQLDENIGSTWYQDADADGFGNPQVTVLSCSLPTGYSSNNLDCNDGNASVKPTATESCNGVDDNCNGQVDENVKSTWYQDLDNDTYGNPNVSTQACSKPAGYVSNGLDCKDTNDAISPSGTEVPNGIDDDCDGVVDDGAYFANCNELKRVVPSTSSGVTTIDPDGAVGPIAPFPVYCDMATDGGGWTLVARSRPGGWSPGCSGTDGQANFGWKSTQGSVNNDTAAYSLNAFALGLRFTEILFGDYASGKTWGNSVYRHTVSSTFLADRSTTHYIIGDPTTVKGSCTTGKGMFIYIGFTNNTDTYHWRDVDGNGFGLTSSGWATCYETCYAGLVNGKQGQIMVR